MRGRTRVTLVMTETAPTRSDRRRAATRRQLLTAAQELLAESGTAFNVQAVADRADVALATLYNHFSSKQDLVSAAAMDAAATVEDYLESRTAHVADPLARLALRGRLHGRLLSSHPREARVLLATAVEVAAVENALRAETLRIAREVAATRGISEDDVRLFATIAYATNQHFMAHQLTSGGHGADEVDRLVSLLMRMAGLSDAEADALAYGPLD